jgi:Metal-dependent hydrolases of the beta-lactamase superfamily I
MIKVLASGSSGNCYIIQAEEEILLLECGINIREIKKGLDFDFSKVKGCLVTHEHKDHCKSINNILAAGVDIYMSEGTDKGIAFLDERYSYRFNYLRHKIPKNIGGFTIIPFSVQHDVNEPLGFLIYHPKIGKIVFATDTYYLKSTFKNVDHILIECNYTEDILPELQAWGARTIKSHMSLETLKETLKSWDLGNTKDITLIHISNDNGDPERFKEEIATLTGITTYAAEPGLIIDC